jgi:diadenosine tetraphosphate (Ap4A) HIT family hydrolase
MKKTFMLLLLGLGLWSLFQIDIQKKFTKENCPFCEPRVLAAQVIYESTLSLALLNYKPAVKGHMLILPKRHVERYEELTAEEAASLQALIAKVDRAERAIFGATGYTLLEKNGREAGQSVPHVHFHYFPRKVGDSNLSLAIRMFLAPWLKPLSPEELESQRDRFVD